MDISHSAKINLAKLELIKISKIMERLNNNKAEQLFWTATRYNGIDYSGISVQTSPHNTMEEALVQLVDLDEKNIKDIERVQVVIQNINKCKHSEILFARYILKTSKNKAPLWEDIEQKFNKSYAQIMRYHSEALIDYFNKFIA